jgi:hypothetical protein
MEPSIVRPWTGSLTLFISSKPTNIPSAMRGKGDNKMENRLEYLRQEIKAERISYGELCELQDLAAEIDPDDVLLREWAGLPED